jgi:hypothetical protein
MTKGRADMRWKEFAEACPEFADPAADRFRKDELVMLGTLRRDGWPRISPCEVDVVAGHLFLGMMWRSPKALDLLRDPGSWSTVLRRGPGTRTAADRQASRPNEPGGRLLTGRVDVGRVADASGPELVEDVSGADGQSGRGVRWDASGARQLRSDMARSRR